MKNTLILSIFFFCSILYSQNYETNFKYSKSNFSGKQIFDSIYQYAKDKKTLIDLYSVSKIVSSKIFSSNKNISYSNEILLKLSYNSEKDVIAVFNNLISNSFQEEGKQFSFHEIIGFHNVYVNYDKKTLNILFSSLSFLDDYNANTRKYHHKIITYFNKRNSFILHKSSSIGNIYDFRNQIIYILNCYESKKLRSPKLSDYFKKFKIKIINKKDIEKIKALLISP